MQKEMITSTSNRQMKYIVQLRQKAKLRRSDGLFIVEGIRMFSEAPRERIHKVYVSRSFFEQAKQRSAYQDLDYEIVDDEVFRRVSDTQTPQGILSLVRMFTYNIERIMEKDSPLFLILEDIQDPGNLGTIFRTAEAAGVDGIFMSRNTVDLYNPKVIRSTMGSIYRVPFLYIEEMDHFLQNLKKNEVTIYAASLQNSRFYDEYSYQGPTAFLIGNEGNGLSEEMLQKSDKYVKIPMQGKVESLNAGVAAGLLVYEVYRQRR